MLFGDVAACHGMACGCAKCNSVAFCTA